MQLRNEVENVTLCLTKKHGCIKKTRYKYAGNGINCISHRKLRAPPKPPNSQGKIHFNGRKDSSCPHCHVVNASSQPSPKGTAVKHVYSPQDYSNRSKLKVSVITNAFGTRRLRGKGTSDTLSDDSINCRVASRYIGTTATDLLNLNRIRPGLVSSNT